MSDDNYFQLFNKDSDIVFLGLRSGDLYWTLPESSSYSSVLYITHKKDKNKINNLLEDDIIFEKLDHRKIIKDSDYYNLNFFHTNKNAPTDAKIMSKICIRTIPKVISYNRIETEDQIGSLYENIFQKDSKKVYDDIINAFSRYHLLETNILNNEDKENNEIDEENDDSVLDIDIDTTSQPSSNIKSIPNLTISNPTLSSSSLSISSIDSTPTTSPHQSSITPMSAVSRVFSLFSKSSTSVTNTTSTPAPVQSTVNNNPSTSSPSSIPPTSNIFLQANIQDEDRDSSAGYDSFVSGSDGEVERVDTDDESFLDINTPKKKTKNNFQFSSPSPSSSVSSSNSTPSTSPLKSGNNHLNSKKRLSMLFSSIQNFKSNLGNKENNSNTNNNNINSNSSNSNRNSVREGIAYNSNNYNNDDEQNIKSQKKISKKLSNNNLNLLDDSSISSSKSSKKLSKKLSNSNLTLNNNSDLLRTSSSVSLLSLESSTTPTLSIQDILLKKVKSKHDDFILPTRLLVRGAEGDMSPVVLLVSFHSFIVYCFFFLIIYLFYFFNFF